MRTGSAFTPIRRAHPLHLIFRIAVLPVAQFVNVSPANRIKRHAKIQGFHTRRRHPRHAADSEFRPFHQREGNPQTHRRLRPGAVAQSARTGGSGVGAGRSQRPPTAGHRDPRGSGGSRGVAGRAAASRRRPRPRAPRSSAVAGGTEAGGGSWRECDAGSATPTFASAARY